MLQSFCCEAVKQQQQHHIVPAACPLTVPKALPPQKRVMGHGTFPQIFQWKSVYETKANQDMWFSKYVSILV